VSRRGFALIAVLWTVTAIAAAAAVVFSTMRLGDQVTANRVTLTRGRWAAEACLAVAAARWGRGRLSDHDTLDLGRGTACSWSVRDPTEGLNVNTADVGSLQSLIGDSLLVARVLERRRVQPFVSIAELSVLAGRELAVFSYLTASGPGTVNLSRAPEPVILALGFPAETVDRLDFRRELGRPYGSLQELLTDLSPTARTVVLGRYAELSNRVTFAAPELLFTADGWVKGRPTVAEIEETVIPRQGYLAVVRRFMQ